jgi:hypothetical protein
MENSFFPTTWHWGEIPKDLLTMPLGALQYRMVRETLVEECCRLIRDVVPGADVRVVPSKKRAIKSREGPTKCLGSADGSLQRDETHSTFSFQTALFDNDWYSFEVTRIPASFENSHIALFFQVLCEVMRVYGSTILRARKLRDNGSLFFSHELMHLSDSFFIALKKTVLLSYLYQALNHAGADYRIPYTVTPKRPRLLLELIARAYDFSIELQAHTIEGRVIHTGFALGQKTSDLKKNASQIFAIKEPIRWDDFGSIKSLLAMVNGEDSWLNVSDGLITHIFSSRENIHRRCIESTESRIRFHGRPFFVSIKGPRHAVFIDAQKDRPKVLLEIQDGKPILRDHGFALKRLTEEFMRLGLPTYHAGLLSEWLVSRSLAKHGTSVFILDTTEDFQRQVVKAVPLDPVKWKIGRSKKKDLAAMGFLDALSSTDGALVIGTDFVPRYSGVILPMSPSEEGAASGGARHSSTRNFSKEFSCLGVVVSDDGPVTVFDKGQKTASL